MGAATSDKDEGRKLTYRERDVDDTLDDHDRRINRLEKAGLIAVGYGIAEGANTIEILSGLVL